LRNIETKNWENKMSNKEIKELYFDDSLLKMSDLGRFFTRFVTYSAYGVGAAATLALVLSDITWLRDAGWLLVLFFADRLLHIGGAERSFRIIPGGSVNIADYVSPDARNVLIESLRRYLALSGDLNLHILLKLVNRKDIGAVFARLDIPIREFEQKVGELLENKILNGAPDEKKSSEVLEALMRSAFEIASRSEKLYIEPRDILAALGMSGDADIIRLFDLFAVSVEDLENAVIFTIVSGELRRLRAMPATLTGIAYGHYRGRHRVMNRAWTARPTPVLDRYSRDLTDLARAEEVGFLVGHAAEYENMTDVLSRASHSNVLLVGEEGVGKETIIAHLAFNMAKDRVSEPLFDRRLVALDIGSLVSGADPAELRSRTQKIVDEIIAAGNIILYIPDIHQIIKTSGSEMISVADILIPAIKGDAFSVIGSTYGREFKESIEKRADFVGSFEMIRVSEISSAEAIKVLSYQSIILERQFGAVVSFAAIKKAVYVAGRYFSGKPLPGSAEGLLREALAEAKQKGEPLVRPDLVIAIAERKINVPIHEAGKAEAAVLLNLEEEIHKRLVDQEEAVTAVSRALREYRSGLSRRGGPVASFLFVGPTGVGKTELSKILASIQFGSEEAMIRFDMSEFQEKNSLPRLLGSLDGSVSGALVEAIAEKPFSLILLDEFEKAHPDILNVFLQVFDDGRLTSADGRTANFENSIIIATSNAHSDFIKSGIEAGRPTSEIGEELKKKLSDNFRPELLNRFSGIIVFQTLARAHILKITELQLGGVSRLARESQGIELLFVPDAISEVARLGYDPVFGARPLRGVISDKIKSVLAEKILRQEIKRGDVVEVRFEENIFKFLS